MDIKATKRKFSKIPTRWDGKRAILEMKDGRSVHWKQMEWIGFYFEFLCQKYLGKSMQIPGPQFGRVGFDGFSEFPWDFKVHPRLNTKGVASYAVIINGREAIEQAIKKYKKVGLIIALGDATYNDEDRSFQIWHKELKGGLSAYEKNRIKRGARSRLRKVAFDLHKIIFLEIEKKHLIKYAAFQEGFRNSDGSPRRAKVMINLKGLKDEIVGEIVFKK